MNLNPNTNSSFTQARMIGTVGLGLVGLLASGEIDNTEKSVAPANLYRKSYAGSIGGQHPTLGLFEVSTTSRAIRGRDVVEQAAISYRRFATSQIPLEADFAQVLSANLWDLYSR